MRNTPTEQEKQLQELVEVKLQIPLKYLNLAKDLAMFEQEPFEEWLSSLMQNILRCEMEDVKSVTMNDFLRHKHGFEKRHGNQ